MYSIADLSPEERKYLFNRQSFSDYATQADNFEHTDSLSMLRIAQQRAGATEPTSNDFDRVRAHATKYHWMLSHGRCVSLKINSRFIMSSEDFGELVKSEEKTKACKYCVAGFLQR